MEWLCLGDVWPRPGAAGVAGDYQPRQNEPRRGWNVAVLGAPLWSSAPESTGPGTNAQWVEVGAWSETSAQAWWSLGVNAEGTTVRFLAHSGDETLQILQAPLAWCGGEWHQVALAWSAQGTVLYLDGQWAAEGVGVTLAPLSEGMTDGMLPRTTLQSKRTAFLRIFQ